MLGLGRMGTELARHLVDDGREVVLWNRTAGRAAGLTAMGAREVTAPEQAVEGATVAVLSLFGPDSVAEVLPQILRPGLLVIDATTVSPHAAVDFDRQARAVGARYADAPVLGTVGPARAGTLGVLVGCAEADWDEVLDVVRLWGAPDRIRRVGQVGSASALKLVVNQGIGVCAAGLGEALWLARHHGLARDVTLEVLSGSMFERMVRTKGDRLASGAFEPADFTLDALTKDLGLAVADQAGHLPVTEAARSRAAEALAAGAHDHDFASVVAHIEGTFEPAHDGHEVGPKE